MAKKEIIILYVEDEADIRKQLSLAINMKKLCTTLLIANNGKEGLELYKQHNPDIVISDIQMPIIDGIEMAKAIKKINPKQPLIFTTAFSQSSYMLSAIELSADAYVLKPIDLRLIISKIENIIENINLKLKLKEQQELLVKQSRFAAMGEMIAMIAHQWRQPLTTINSTFGKLKLLKDMNMLEDEEFNKSYTSVNELILYMSKTIDDFRNFFDDKKREEYVKLSDLILNSKKLVEFRLKDIKVDFDIEYNVSQDISLYININRFTQVILNILNNSLDEFVSKRQEDGKITVLCNEDDTNITIEICDNAGGIPKNIISKIFEPYFSTKSENGTGIGLYMTKIIIEEHMDSSIEVLNKDNGACFIIKLAKEKVIKG